MQTMASSNDDILHQQQLQKVLAVLLDNNQNINHQIIHNNRISHSNHNNHSNHSKHNEHSNHNNHNKKQDNGWFSKYGGQFTNFNDNVASINASPIPLQDLSLQQIRTINTQNTGNHMGPNDLCPLIDTQSLAQLNHFRSI